MSETIMLPTNYELVVKDKATAMQYALDKSLYWSQEGKYDLDLEKAKNIFKLFCDNVNLPDVENGNFVFVPQDNSNASVSCDPNFLVGDEQTEDKKKYTKLSDVLKEDFQQDPFNEKALTYEDVAKELFFNDDELYHYITTDGGIKHSTVYNAYGSPTICTSRKQAEKLLAINRLMNIAKYLNGDWTPDWRNEGEAKFCIILNNGNLRVDLDLFTTCNNSFAYFRTKELAQQAIEILGEDTIRLALSTDW